jgi:hypothetical protein
MGQTTQLSSFSNSNWLAGCSRISNLVGTTMGRTKGSTLSICTWLNKMICRLLLLPSKMLAL